MDEPKPNRIVEELYKEPKPLSDEGILAISLAVILPIIGIWENTKLFIYIIVSLFIMLVVSICVFRTNLTTRVGPN
jgi:uncharacterized membrane protein YoaK (UPF0700 family)